jgi:DNA-binding transcriptional MerR regulator
MTEELRYSIGKLAEAARVTPRTIRYYTAEGLLPPPQTQGRYALYTDNHLRWLRLIQRLKNAFLPLATIRALMAALSDADVQALLEACPAAPPDAQRTVRVRATEPHAHQSDLEYIAQILAVTGQSAPVPSETLPRKRALLVSPALRPALPGEQEERTAARSETWERVPITSDVELHVRAPLTPDDRERIERLIAAARTLFGKSE